MWFSDGAQRRDEHERGKPNLLGLCLTPSLTGHIHFHHICDSQYLQVLEYSARMLTPLVGFPIS